MSVTFPSYRVCPLPPQLTLQTGPRANRYRALRAWATIETPAGSSAFRMVNGKKSEGQGVFPVTALTSVTVAKAFLYSAIDSFFYDRY